MTDPLIHPVSLPQDTKNTRTTGPEVWASIDDPDAVKTLDEIAAAVLAAHGLTGRLQKLYGDKWTFNGHRNGQGASASIEGEPDEAVLNEAAAQIVAAIEDPTRIR